MPLNSQTTPYQALNPQIIAMKSSWTKEENKTFESALAFFDEKTPNRWFKVAAMIPGKSVYDVINQYRELVADVNDIEAGLVPVPVYSSPPFTLRGRSYDQQRKIGVPWTQEEHRRFLLGLEKHGKGDWKNISRNYVITKNPSQVASHAQKYYLRQLSGGKEKRRPSIHDITTGLVDITSSNNIATQDPSGENNGSLTDFDSACGDPLIENPCILATHAHLFDTWLI